MAIKTKFAVSAFIDLLGFSSHLSLANNDTRTIIGEMAIKRLKELKIVLEFVDKEIEKYDACYPDVKIEKIRFNDAIFFTMELSEVIQTEVGDNNWKGLKSTHHLQWLEEGKALKHSSGTLSELNIQSNNTAKFLSLIARVHSYINLKEKENNFPGARTVVCTGNKVVDTEEELDAFSANFSISNAYFVGELGSKGDFGGNNFYVDENVARIIAIEERNIQFLYYSNIVSKTKHYDPYTLPTKTKDRISHIFGHTEREFEYSRIIKTSMFNKEYTFRELNVSPLTWIQVRHYIENIVGTKNLLNQSKGLHKINNEWIIKNFEADLIPLDELHKKIREELMFLTSVVSMGENYLNDNFGAPLIPEI